MHAQGHGDHGPRISIHALRKESDPVSHPVRSRKVFQSTLSVRRATYYALTGKPWW